MHVDIVERGIGVVNTVDHATIRPRQFHVNPSNTYVADGYELKESGGEVVEYLLANGLMFRESGLVISGITAYFEYIYERRDSGMFVTDKYGEPKAYEHYEPEVPGTEERRRTWIVTWPDASDETRDAMLERYLT